MSEYFKTLSGTWTRETDSSIKGIVDASGTARSIGGSETAQDYEFYATVNITNGKAALIVNFTYSQDWEERYIEMILDQANDKVTLDAVIRNSDGTEQSRQTLASRNMTINLATDYRCRMVSKETTTNVYAVYGYINEFLLVEAEDLASAFQKGMHGFECLGSANEYSEFSNVTFKSSLSYSALSDVKSRLKIDQSDTSYDTELAGCIEEADAWIDDKLQNYTTVPLSSVPTAIKHISADKAADIYKTRGDPEILETKFGARAKEKLQRYIDETYKPGELKRV